MIAERDKTEVIVVGAGPAGLACGYVLAGAGVDVTIVERGQYPGAKNMFGGIFFSDQLSKLIPGFYGEAPVERFVAKKQYAMLVDDSQIAMTFEPEEYKRPPYNHSFIVRRSSFDRWLAEKVREQGASILCGVTVEDFIWEGKRVVGVRTSQEDEDVLLADVVVCAEGANSLLSEKAGLRTRISMRHRCLSVKEVIGLPEETIKDRFCLTGREGAAYEYFGDVAAGMLGNGFIYTNRDSVSVGVGFVLSEMYGRREPITTDELLERFKAHPCVQPLIRGGKTLEYSAHMIPMDGYKNLPKLYTHGLMLAGDAAGLVNNSLCHEGVNMAMASGIAAAETILERRAERRYDARSLSLYKQRLQDSFVLDNMKSAREFLDLMRSHKELTHDYPHAVKDAMYRYFEVGDAPKRIAKWDVLHMLRSRMSFMKVAKMATAMLKGGI